MAFVYINFIEKSVSTLFSWRGRKYFPWGHVSSEHKAVIVFRTFGSHNTYKLQSQFMLK